MIPELVLAATVSVTAHCGQIADAAEVVMEASQTGVPMREMMESALDSGNDLLPQLVESAYSEPRYTTSEYQARAVLDFTDNWYLECVRVMRD